MINGLILMLYWLLSDVTGCSLGKLAVGTQVVKRDGTVAGVRARIARTIPIAIGPALLLIPLFGYILALVVSIPVILLEDIHSLAVCERLGDKLAGTAVVNRRRRA